MAASKTSDLTALTGANAAVGDLIGVSDVSVSTSKKMTLAEHLQSGVVTILAANALTGANTAVGDLYTVDDVSVPEVKKQTLAELFQALGIAGAAASALTGANSATGDLFPIIDVSASNAVLKITRAELEVAIRDAAMAAAPIAAGGTLSVTQALHAYRTINLDTAAGSVCTLPAAAGTKARYRFAVSVLATSNSHIIKVTGTDVIQGVLPIIDTDSSNAVSMFGTASDSDTITLNRSTTGSVRIGEYIELEDTKTGFWSIVTGFLTGTGTVATPFSATV